MQIFFENFKIIFMRFIKLFLKIFFARSFVLTVLFLTLFFNFLFVNSNALAQIGDANNNFFYLWEKDLNYGMKEDEDIAALQQVLTLEKVYSGPMTGNFFNLTLQGVKNFQKKYEINSTGYVGPITRSQLNKLYRQNKNLNINIPIQPIPYFNTNPNSKIKSNQNLLSKFNSKAIPNTSSSINLISPKGGEKLIPNNPYKISWKSSHDIGPVDIILEKHIDQVTNYVVKSAVIAKIGPGENGIIPQEFLWLVNPGYIGKGENFKLVIRKSMPDNYAGTEIFDRSDGTFSIQNKVIPPPVIPPIPVVIRPAKPTRPVSPVTPDKPEPVDPIPGVKLPVITRIYPKKVKVNDKTKITISGRNFSNLAEINFYKDNNTILHTIKNIEFKDSGKISFLLDNKLEFGDYKISVKNTDCTEDCESNKEDFEIIEATKPDPASTAPFLSSVSLKEAKSSDVNVIIFGRNLTKVTKINFYGPDPDTGFAGTISPVTSKNGSVTFTTDGSIGSGTYGVSAAIGDTSCEENCESNTIVLTIKAEPGPTISKIEPSSAERTGTTVIITGNNLSKVDKINFYKKDKQTGVYSDDVSGTLTPTLVSASSTKFITDGTILSGDYKISVENDDTCVDNCESNKKDFKISFEPQPTISIVIPSIAKHTGTMVTIYGSNLSKVAKINFYQDDTLIKSVSPDATSKVSAGYVIFTTDGKMASGLYQISVTNTDDCGMYCESGKVEFIVKKSRFTAPVLDHIRPSEYVTEWLRDVVGTPLEVTIYGKNLENVKKIRLYEPDQSHHEYYFTPKDSTYFSVSFSVTYSNVAEGYYNIYVIKDDCISLCQVQLPITFIAHTYKRDRSGPTYLSSPYLIDTGHLIGKMDSNRSKTQLSGFNLGPITDIKFYQPGSTKVDYVIQRPDVTVNLSNNELKFPNSKLPPSGIYEVSVAGIGCGGICESNRVDFYVIKNN